MATNASPPKPQNASVRNSRRLRGGFECAFIQALSLEVEEIVHQENGQSQLAQWSFLEILSSGFSLGCIGIAAKRELEDAADLAIMPRTFPHHPISQRSRHRV